MAKSELKTRNPRRVCCVVTAAPRRRGPVPFKENGLARAIRAMRKAGLDPVSVEINKTGAFIHAGKPIESAGGGNELDQWLGQHNAHEA